MQENTKWYWEQKKHQQVIVFPTRNIVHICIDFMVVKDVHNINRNFFNRNQEMQALQRHLICLTNSDHDYIFY